MVGLFLLWPFGLIWMTVCAWSSARARSKSLAASFWVLAAIGPFAALVLPAYVAVIAALWLTFSWFRATEALLFPHRYTPSQTVWLVLFLIDPRPQARSDHSVSPAILISLGLAILLIIPSSVVAIQNVGNLYAKGLLGAIAIYAAAAGSDRLVRGVLACYGVYYAPFHRSPVRADSISEFWNQRWNRVVGQFLRTVIFFPLAKRTGHLKSALLLTFLLSAIFHMIPLLLCRQIWAALMMGSFFVIHGILVIGEHTLKISRWPLWVRHIHVLFWFAVTLPLFTLPFLQALGLIHFTSMTALFNELL